MRRKWGRIGWVVVGMIAGAGCSVGEGAPDGWRYLSTGEVAVAHPKRWEETRTGAVLRGADGRTEAALSVVSGARAAGASVRPSIPEDAPAGAAVPTDARRESLEIDGTRAQVFSYARPAADGRPAGHVEVRARDRAGHPVVVRAWAVDGTAGDPSLLREIVNSIEFTSRRPR